MRKSKNGKNMKVWVIKESLIQYMLQEDREWKNRKWKREWEEDSAIKNMKCQNSEGKKVECEKVETDNIEERGMIRNGNEQRKKK